MIEHTIEEVEDINTEIDEFVAELSNKYKIIVNLNDLEWYFIDEI